MGRKRGPDNTKIDKIRKLLSKYPNGLWIREIARQSNMDKSTVSIYLSKYMNAEVEDIFPVKNSLIKIVRLKK